MRNRMILIGFCVIALAGLGLAQSAGEQAPPKQQGTAYVDADGNGVCDYRDSGQPRGQMNRGQGQGQGQADGAKAGPGGNRGKGGGQTCRKGNGGGKGNGSGNGNGQRARRRDGSCQAK